MFDNQLGLKIYTNKIRGLDENQEVSLQMLPP